MLVAEPAIGQVQHDRTETDTNDNDAVPLESRTASLGMLETGGRWVDRTSTVPEPLGTATGEAQRSASPMLTAVLQRSPHTRWSPCRRGGASPTGW